MLSRPAVRRGARPAEVQSPPVNGFSFATDVRVRFAETDAQGVAHNAAYLVWFEVARIDYLERFAGGYQAIRDRGLEALTIEAHVRYLAPSASTTAFASMPAAATSAERD